MSDFLSRVESVKCFRGECRVCSFWGWFLGCFGFLVFGVFMCVGVDRVLSERYVRCLDQVLC